MTDTENLTRDLVNLFSEGEPEAALGRLSRFAARKAKDALLTGTEADRWARVAAALEKAELDARQESPPIEPEKETDPD